MTESLPYKLLPKGFLIGHAQDEQAGTGCTVILSKEGAVASCSVRGAAPATIETDLLDPSKTVQAINAVILTGGSAFGLAAASGVTQWLEEQSCGFDVAGIKVPIVCGAAIFDLALGDAYVRPDKQMGYTACLTAQNRVLSGMYGASLGASVGKLLGMKYAMKSGLGVAAVKLGELELCAVVVCNAVGNIAGRRQHKAIAGVRNPANRLEILDGLSALSAAISGLEHAQTQSDKEPTNSSLSAGANTTIGCIITNAKMTKAQAAHVANMTHDGYARAIEPVHTSMDGDAVFVMSSSSVAANVDLVGALAAQVMEDAIVDSVERYTHLNIS